MFSRDGCSTFELFYLCDINHIINMIIQKGNGERRKSKKNGIKRHK